MLERWLETVKKSKISTIRKIELYNSLDVMYRTGGRVYHTMDHIKHCFEELDILIKVFPNTFDMLPNVEVELTLWCHDVFKSEEKSAEFAEEICSELGIFAPRIAEFVLLTKHNKVPTDGIGALITDIDLSILGQSYKVYREYQTKIYKEYNAESFWKVFAEKRIPILESILNRNDGKIYFIDYFYKKCGKDAFTNMHREIIELKEKLNKTGV